MERGHWEADTVTDPMTTTSLRMPKSLLDTVRTKVTSNRQVSLSAALRHR